MTAREADEFRNAYIANSDFIEQQYQVLALDQLILLEGVEGAARLIVLPSFESEVLQTFVYFRDRVEVSVVTGATSLWDSLFGSPWLNEPDPDGFEYTPFVAADAKRRSKTMSLSKAKIASEVASWDALVDASSRTPPCMTDACDGVGYHHRIRGPGVAFDSFWGNPSSNEHPEQTRLLENYYKLVQLAGLKV